MSTEPTSPSDDIQRLINEGYGITIKQGCLIVTDVPYLDVSVTPKEDGVLFCPFPSDPGADHTFYFSDIPHNTQGKPFHVANDKVTNWNGHSVKSQLSFKKHDGAQQVPYSDHYDKVTYYVTVLSSLANTKAGDKRFSAKKFRPVDTSSDDSTPFMYADTNSSRAGINHINDKFTGQKIAIIGVGGTGSYVTDLVAKTQVAEIHLYDDDLFSPHNAFRAPGAASLEVLNQPILKVEYFKGIYSNMHKGIFAHPYKVTPEVINNEFGEYDFVFVCIDSDKHKKTMLELFVDKSIPCIDSGVAVQNLDDVLGATVRVSTLSPEKSDHLEKRIPCTHSDENDYSSNIQIAEANAIAASFSVLKWKKMTGFYHDNQKEHHSTIMLNSNQINNHEKVVS